MNWTPLPNYKRKINSTDKFSDNLIGLSVTLEQFWHRSWPTLENLSMWRRGGKVSFYTRLSNQFETLAKIFLYINDTSIYSWIHAQKKGLWYVLPIHLEQTIRKNNLIFKNRSFSLTCISKTPSRNHVCCHIRIVSSGKTTYKKFQVKRLFVYVAWNACGTI